MHAIALRRFRGVDVRRLFSNGVIEKHARVVRADRPSTRCLAHAIVSSATGWAQPSHKLD